MKNAIRRQYRETKRNLHLRRNAAQIEAAELERHYRIMTSTRSC